MGLVKFHPTFPVHSPPLSELSSSTNLVWADPQATRIRHTAYKIPIRRVQILVQSSKTKSKFQETESTKAGKVCTHKQTEIPNKHTFSQQLVKSSFPKCFLWGGEGCFHMSNLAKLLCASLCSTLCACRSGGEAAVPHQKWSGASHLCWPSATDLLQQMVLCSISCDSAHCWTVLGLLRLSPWIIRLFRGNHAIPNGWSWFQFLLLFQIRIWKSHDMVWGYGECWSIEWPKVRHDWIADDNDDICNTTFKISL